MQRIGIYSGTFDPVHNGHVGFALRAIKQAGLERVVFLPEASPRGKTGVTGITHRCELLRRATAQHSELSVRTLGDDQFTVQRTLPQLQALYPKARLSLLVGSDVVRTFSGRWPGLDQLFEQVDLIIGLRENDRAQDVADLLSALPVKMSPNVTLVKSPAPTISSTRIRQGTAKEDAPDLELLYLQHDGLYTTIGASDAAA